MIIAMYLIDIISIIIIVIKNVTIVFAANRVKKPIETIETV